MRAILFLAAFLCMTATCPAGTLLFSIGGTDLGQPSRIVAINRAQNSATPLFDLNSQTAAFSGLTYNSSNGLFYAVMDNFVSASVLVSFALADSGAFTPVMTLDAGLPDPLLFNGGLAYNPGDGSFYSIANSTAGVSSLYRIDAGANSLTLLADSLPCTFNGGLAINGSGLSAICNDSAANSSLYDLTLAGVVVPGSGAGIGQAFYGGLVLDGQIYALNSDSTGAGYLNSVQGGVANNLFGVGYGFYNAGLTTGPDVVPGTGPAPDAPEPGSWSLLAAGLTLIAAATRRRYRTERPGRVPGVRPN